MSEISNAISSIRCAVDVVGVRAMSRRSGVGYTTIRALIERDWQSKQLGILSDLKEAADAILAEQESAQ